MTSWSLVDRQRLLKGLAAFILSVEGVLGILSELCSYSGFFTWDLDPNFVLRGADKSLARPTFRCILFDGENISFDASLLYR